MSEYFMYFCHLKYIVRYICKIHALLQVFYTSRIYKIKHVIWLTEFEK